MALPSSGTLSINDIVGEFGGSAPHALSEYYRGGSLVPDVTQNSSVPASGTIKITDFYGAVNYTPLSILGNAAWLQSSTTSTSSAQTVTVPSGTKSVIALGSIGTNASRGTLHTGVTIGSTTLTEIISTNSPASEYTFDSAIYAANFSTTGSQTVTFNYSGGQSAYGSGHAIIFLSKPFASTPSASDSDGANDLNATSHTLTIDKFGEGIHVGTATVRNTSPNMTNMETLINQSGSSTRHYLHGFGISSGSYNVSSSLASNATLFDTNFGETFAVASFAPTKFSEN